MSLNLGIYYPSPYVNSLTTFGSGYACVNNPTVNPGALGCVFSIYLKFSIPERFSHISPEYSVLLSNGNWDAEQSLIIGLKKEQDSNYYLFAKIGKQNFYALYGEKAINLECWNTVCISSIAHKDQKDSVKRQIKYSLNGSENYDMKEGTPENPVNGTNEIINYNGYTIGEVKLSDALSEHKEDSHGFVGGISCAAILMAPQIEGPDAPTDLSGSAKLFNENESIDETKLQQYVVAHYVMDSMPAELVTDQSIESSNIQNFYINDVGEENKAIPAHSNKLRVKRGANNKYVSDLDYNYYDGNHDNYPSQPDLKEMLSMMSAISEYISLCIGGSKRATEFAVEQFVLFYYKELLTYPQLQVMRDYFDDIKTREGKPVIPDGVNADFVTGIIERLAKPSYYVSDDEDYDGSAKVKEFVDKVVIALGHMDKMLDRGVIGTVVACGALAYMVWWAVKSIHKGKIDSTVKGSRDSIYDMCDERNKDPDQQISLYLSRAGLLNSLKTKKSSSVTSINQLFIQDDYVFSINQLKSKLNNASNKYGSVDFQIQTLAGKSKLLSGTECAVDVEFSVTDPNNAGVLQGLGGSTKFKEIPSDSVALILDKATKYKLPEDYYLFKFNSKYSVKANLTIGKKKITKEYVALANIYTIPDRPSEAVYRPNEDIYLSPSMMSVCCNSIQQNFTDSIKTFSSPSALNLQPSEKQLKSFFIRFLECVNDKSGLTVFKYHPNANLDLIAVSSDRTLVFNLDEFSKQCQDKSRGYPLEINCFSFTAVLLYLANLLFSDIETYNIVMKSHAMVTWQGNQFLYIAKRALPVNWLEDDFIENYIVFSQHCMPIIRRDSAKDKYSYIEPCYKLSPTSGKVPVPIYGIDIKPDPNTPPFNYTSIVPKEYFQDAFWPKNTVIPEHLRYKKGYPNSMIGETTIDKKYNINIITNSRFEIRKCWGTNPLSECFYGFELPWEIRDDKDLSGVQQKPVTLL